MAKTNTLECGNTCDSGEKELQRKRVETAP